MTTLQTSNIPTDLKDGWSVGDPSQFGFNPAILADMRLRIADGKLDNVHAVLIARNGALVYEQYSAGKDQNGLAPPTHVTFDPATRHNGNSITKSVTSLLIGIALERQWIANLETPVFSYFPEHEDISTPEKQAITLHHLLAMSDGWSSSSLFRRMTACVKCATHPIPIATFWSAT